MRNECNKIISKKEEPAAGLNGPAAGVLTPATLPPAAGHRRQANDADKLDLKEQINSAGTRPVEPNDENIRIDKECNTIAGAILPEQSDDLGEVAHRLANRLLDWYRLDLESTQVDWDVMHLPQENLLELPVGELPDQLDLTRPRPDSHDCLADLGAHEGTPRKRLNRDRDSSIAGRDALEDQGIDDVKDVDLLRDQRLEIRRGHHWYPENRRQHHHD